MDAGEDRWAQSEGLRAHCAVLREASDALLKSGVELRGVGDRQQEDRRATMRGLGLEPDAAPARP